MKSSNLVLLSQRLSSNKLMLIPKTMYCPAGCAGHEGEYALESLACMQATIQMPIDTNHTVYSLLLENTTAITLFMSRAINVKHRPHFGYRFGSFSFRFLIIIAKFSDLDLQTPSHLSWGRPAGGFPCPEHWVFLRSFKQCSISPCEHGLPLIRWC